MSLKNTKKKRIDDYFVRATREDEHSKVRENKAHVGVHDRSMETMISKEDVKIDENEDFFATLETPRLANHAVMAKESKEPTGVPGSPISTGISKEDVKTDESNDFSINLETIYLFGAASSTKMNIFDDISVNPADEMIEENSQVSVPSTSAIIKEEEEWNTGSSSPAKQTSLLEANETIFLSSSCEYANFEIGTSGTYGWEVDPSSGVNRIYGINEQNLEKGELGKSIQLESSTNAEYKPVTEDNVEDTPVTHGNEMTTEGKLVCFDCTASFEEAFKQHIATHDGYRKFKCEVCDKRFRKRCDLTRHERVHTGERPYGCSQCEKRFKDKDTIRRHKFVHSGERPCGCLVCGKRFKDSGVLRRHMRIHSVSTAIATWGKMLPVTESFNSEQN